METSRARPDFSMERKARGLVAGVDEAGRGPLAGPVVAAAIILDPRRIPDGLDDSKRLSQAKREALCAILRAEARVGIGAASVAEIGRLNILGASLLAMRRAVAALRVAPDLVLVDGNRDPGLAHPTRLVVGGDALSASIAAASIVAKVTRDRIMAALDRRHPRYGWGTNQGYATAEHLAALAAHGPCVHHRAGFAPVRQLSLFDAPQDVAGGDSRDAIPSLGIS
jgi:ribonuclease HII